jgi:tetratricopeptide (TPR) repeat protein
MSIENQRRSSINTAFKFLTVFNMLIFAGLLHAENLNVDSLRLLVGFDLHHPKVSSSSMKACLRLSDYYSKISKDSAKKYGLAAFHISSILKNDTGMAASFASIAKAYNTCGYFDSAAPYLDSSQAMFLKINEPRGLISLRNNRANMMMRTGDYVGAIENYQQNLIIADSMKDYINMIYAYNNMGIAYYDWKKYNYALKQYNSALEVLNTMGNEEITGPVFNNIGEVYYDKKVYDTALIYFNKALIVNVKYEKKRSILISLTSLGDVYYENKEYSIALGNYEKALKISKSVPDEINTAIITIKLGKVYNKLGNYKTAKSYFTEGLMLAKRHESANSILDAYSGLIDNAKGLDDADKVYQYGKKYIQLKDSLFNENSLNKISVLETKFKTAQKAKEILLLESKQREKDIEIQAQKNLKYALIIFLVVLLLGVVLLFNRYKLKKDKESAEVEKARLRLEQRLLHSQMNPHFIFNSLNSINSYIGNNNVKEAQEYLIKFAKLMRLILENSRRLMVSLADEINALKIYLELEKLRFEGLFEFDIDVDSEIENEYVYIPPLLIQPFVENAIIHGLKGRDAHKTKALIKLCFIKEKEIIKCVIEDNGVGRGQTIKGRNSASKHVSLGTQVTIERLAILRQEKNVNIGMDIIDLKDASGSAKGTKVVLKLPFEEE